MRRLAALLACGLLGAACAQTPVPGETLVMLPRELHAGEHVLLEIELGEISAGKEIVVRTPDGKLIGTASPHGTHASAGTFTLPVPDALLDQTLRNGRLRLYLQVEPAGAARRPASASEVRAVRAAIVHD